MLDRTWLQVASLILLNDSNSSCSCIVMLLQRVASLVVLISLDVVVVEIAVLSTLGHAQSRNHHTVFNTVTRAKMLVLIRNKSADLLV